jgi:hypothetical protein
MILTGKRHIVAAIWAVAVLISAVASAQTRTVSLAWDQNREPNVAGYIVYVGTQPGNYSESLDAGNVTAFTYEGSGTQAYYFAVAAYFPGPIIGAKSKEVASVPVGTAVPRVPTTSGSSTSLSPLARGMSCSNGDCPSSVLYESSRQLTGIATAPDGRVLVVEERRTVTAISPANGGFETAYSTDGSEIAALAIPPDFQQTRHVFAAEVVRTLTGSLELDIVRYREVSSRLGERAVVVAGLPVTAGGAALSVDAAGALYVAIGSGDTRDPFAGKLLRYSVAGGIPADNPHPTSPVVADGISAPTAVSVDADGRVWLAGSDAQGSVVAVVENPSSIPGSRELAVKLRARELVVGLVPRGLTLPDGATALLLATTEAVHDVRWLADGALSERKYPIPGDYKVGRVARAGERLVAAVSDREGRFRVIEWAVP